MYEKILVPVDFTDKTIKALDVAKCIAKKTNAEIALIHVVKAALAVYMDELGIYKSKSKTGQKFLEEIIEQNERKMEKYMEKLESEGLKISYKLKIDSSPDKIAELVAEEGYDLTIVGNYEHQRFDEFLKKTHPERIAKLAQNPVITVNHTDETFSPGRILVPTNLEDDCTQKMNDLLAFAQKFESELQFVFVNTPANFHTTPQIRKRSRIWFEKHGLSGHQLHVYNTKQLQKGLLNAADFYESDMIALFSKHSESLRDLIKGNITEYLITRSDIPVMTFNLNQA
ncbi:universal stress protein [Roseivirga thermotolerans]|uniref:universal stress protein n=1 Tax=Roseivirga thermotolerans TaxID=1758176 RepID=UPI00273D126E|nr:universal stress protein [Roseivirga thermotolerans]